MPYCWWTQRDANRTLSQLSYGPVYEVFGDVNCLPATELDYRKRGAITEPLLLPTELIALRYKVQYCKFRALYQDFFYTFIIYIFPSITANQAPQPAYCNSLFGKLFLCAPTHLGNIIKNFTEPLFWVRPQVNPRYALKKMKERKKCPNLRMQSARGSFAR